MSHKSPNFANIWSSVFDASQIDFIVNVHLTLVTGENHFKNCYFIIIHVYRLYKSQTKWCAVIHKELTSNQKVYYTSSDAHLVHHFEKKQIFDEKLFGFKMATFYHSKTYKLITNKYMDYKFLFVFSYRYKTLAQTISSKNQMDFYN